MPITRKRLKHLNGVFSVTRLSQHRALMHHYSVGGNQYLILSQSLLITLSLGFCQLYSYLFNRDI